MYLKPPKSGRSRMLLGLATVGATVLGFAGAGLAVGAGPALADPANNYVAVGSNTTQDVMNAYADVVGDGVLGSFDAVTPISGSTYTANGVTGVNVEIAPGKTTSTSGTQNFCDFTRPDGSSAGIAALEYSINAAFNPSGLPPAPDPQPGCVDIARSSSGPTTVAGGDLVYMPFAFDAVTTVTGPTTSGVTETFTQGTTTYTNYAVPETNITFGSDLTEQNLIDLFTSCIATTVDAPGTTTPVATYWPLGDTTAGQTTLPAGDTQVDLYIPQPGSGTLSFWASTLGFNKSSPPPCDHQSIQGSSSGGDGSATFAGDLVEENDGLPYLADPNGLGPFSIAQWLSQEVHGHNNRTLGTALNSLVVSGTAVAPTTGTGSSMLLNTAFPIWRYVYNVVQTGRVISGYTDSDSQADGTFDPGLAALFAGSASKLCENKLVIGNYGFAPMTASIGSGLLCGDTSETAVTGLVEA
jgi:hypothetical protein